MSERDMPARIIARFAHDRHDGGYWFASKVRSPGEGEAAYVHTDTPAYRGMVALARYAAADLFSDEKRAGRLLDACWVQVADGPFGVPTPDVAAALAAIAALDVEAGR